MNSPPGIKDMEGENECPTCEFQQNLNFLRQIDFFAGLPVDFLKVIAYLCERKTYKPGEFIFEQDADDGQAVYLISGQAQTMLTLEGQSRIMQVVTEGTFLGGLALLSHTRRLFSFKVLTDCVCLVISRDKFEKMIDQHPHHIKSLVQGMARRVNDWERRWIVRHACHCDFCRTQISVSLL